MLGRLHLQNNIWMSGLSIAFVFLNAVSKIHTSTSNKTHNFVTFYKFLINLGVHHTSEPYPTITVSTGNCPRNYPTKRPYTDHPIQKAGGDQYARAACTGNQTIYQGVLAPHLFH